MFKPFLLLHQNQVALLKNISTGIGFLLIPPLPELEALSSLPASLTLAHKLPRLLNPCGCSLPVITTSAGFVPKHECRSFVA